METKNDYFRIKLREMSGIIIQMYSANKNE